MGFLLDPLTQGFMRRALVVGIATGATGGLLGVFLLMRGLALLSDGLAHAAFGGIALGLLLGLTPERTLFVALPFTVLVALGIQALRRRGVGGDAATGVLFSLAFALGILLLGLRRPGAPAVSVEGLLFGNLLVVSPEMTVTTLAVAALAAGLLAWLWPRLAYASFDPELAALSGVAVASVELVLFATAAVVVVVGVKTVGVVLVGAFIVIPAATARLLGGSLGRIAATAVALGMTGSAVGLLISYHLDVASGATVILTLGAVFVAALVVRRA
jgi:zinc transport system permease protein